MTTLRAYATLADYKAYVTARGQTSTTDTADDAVIEMLLKASSRWFDERTARRFYPYIQTRYFDVPDGRVLKLDEDLLEVITLVNGDGVTIPSTEYALRPRNESPYWGIRLVDNSTYIWASDGSGDTHDVIAVTGIWGYHNDYTNAWDSASTLAEALDTSETGLDVADGSGYAVGNLVRVDNELGYLSAIATNTLTSTRGESGSTAATHDSGATVRVWQPMDNLKEAVLETAMQAYKRRFGQSGNINQTVTAAGVVLIPKDIPVLADMFVESVRKYT